MDKIRRNLDRRREAMRQQRLENSADRLYNTISKHITTLSIGYLENIERTFGYLWGHGIDYQDLTDSQRECRKHWKIFRDRFLDCMHGRIHMMGRDLEVYEVDFLGYNINFSFGDQEC